MLRTSSIMRKSISRKSRPTVFGSVEETKLVLKREHGTLHVKHISQNAKKVSRMGYYAYPDLLGVGLNRRDI